MNLWLPPIALTEHADEYFYKLLLPLTKRLYLVYKKLVPETHIQEIQDTINKLSIERQIALLRLSLFFDIPALDDLLVQGIAASLTKENASTIHC